MNDILHVEQLTKIFKTGEKQLTVLDNISFSIQEGESVAIVGPSGSGKTTLLGICAGLDTVTSGKVVLAGQDLGPLSEDERAFLRNREVGFIFQNFQLLPTLTALENVTVPLELRGERNVTRLASELLERVGLADRVHHYPSQLSGGEQQRVALARAFITSPRVLFADEPTGNLDEETADMVSSLLFELNRESDTTLVLVTHNMELAHHTRRIVKLKGGKLVEDIKTSGFENE